VDYLKGINAAVTICDLEGTLVYMNEKSQEVFKDDGGKELIWKSIYDCHPEPARTKVKDLISGGTTNIYTVEKKGVKKIIYQSPWRNEQGIAGMVEISIELPAELPHFVRT
jgi:hypothetical protein